MAAERALGVPERPRFDHVAVTVDDRAATDAFYAPLGFSFIGTIEQPHDPRGFSIGYLKSGATVLEVFTYEAGTQTRSPQPDAPGFALGAAGRHRPDRRRDRGRRRLGGGRAGRPRRLPVRHHRRPGRVTAPGSDDWVRPLGATGL